MTMAADREKRSNFEALHQEFWRLHLSVNINPQTNKQTNKQTIKQATVLQLIKRLNFNQIYLFHTNSY